MSGMKDAINEGIRKFSEAYELGNPKVMDELRLIMNECCKTAIKNLKLSAIHVGSMADTPKTSESILERVRVRRKTGYNVYIQHRFQQLSNQLDGTRTNSHAVMTQCSREWRTLPETEKAGFEERARLLNEEQGTPVPVPKKKGKKKITGYNLFYVRNKDEIKRDLQTGEKLMSVVGSRWMALSDETKKHWNKLALEYVPPAGAAAVEPVEPVEPEPEVELEVEPKNGDVTLA